MFTPCPKCHAEISVDREKCPHCGTPVTSEDAELSKLESRNVALRSLKAERAKKLQLENAALEKEVLGGGTPAAQPETGGSSPV